MPGVLLEKSSAGEAAQGKEKPKNEAPASRAVVGIIYPPPEVRSIPLFLLFINILNSFRVNTLFTQSKQQRVFIPIKAHPGAIIVYPSLLLSVMFVHQWFTVSVTT